MNGYWMELRFLLLWWFCIASGAFNVLQIFPIC